MTARPSKTGELLYCNLGEDRLPIKDMVGTASGAAGLEFVPVEGDNLHREYNRERTRVIVIHGAPPLSSILPPAPSDAATRGRSKARPPSPYEVFSRTDVATADNLAILFVSSSTLHWPVLRVTFGGNRRRYLLPIHLTVLDGFAMDKGAGASLAQAKWSALLAAIIDTPLLDKFVAARENGVRSGHEILDQSFLDFDIRLLPAMDALCQGFLCAHATAVAGGWGPVEIQAALEKLQSRAFLDHAGPEQYALLRRLGSMRTRVSRPGWWACLLEEGNVRACQTAIAHELGLTDLELDAPHIHRLVCALGGQDAIAPLLVAEAYLELEDRWKRPGRA